MAVDNVLPIIKENEKRLGVLFSAYDPFHGVGSFIERKNIVYTCMGEKWDINIPMAMYNEHCHFIDDLVKAGSIEAYLTSLKAKPTRAAVLNLQKDFFDIRFKYDFEFWCIVCVKIQDKKTKLPVPFRLNRSQRRFLAKMEEMRVARKPIRIILLKARQWGGSTLTQVYMAWMQIIIRTNWHSAIVADVEDQARNIRGMYSKLATYYPSAVGEIKFAPYEGSMKNKIIKGRDCIVGVGSAQKPDSLRSYDFAMGHLSEVGLWKSTAQKSAEDLAQGFRATIPDDADTLIVEESTAKGVGNFFHRGWQDAVAGESNYTPVFVPWFEIEMYQRPIDAKDLTTFIKWVLSDEYASYLWSLGATLQGINWYYHKKRDFPDDWRMKSEYPSTAEEAFQSTGKRVFPPAYVMAARKSCLSPEMYGDIYGKSQKGKGAFEGLVFQQDPKGLLLIWALPDKTVNVSNRYVVTVDIGGRTDKADWSVIKVIDRYWMMEGGNPETVATWRGHIDQDLVSWKAAQIAKFYNNALLVVEYNSLNTDDEHSEGEHHLTVLDEVVPFYSNIYARTDPEKVRQGLAADYGFHTNRSTKPMVIDELNGALRERAFNERDLRVCDEEDTYEIKPNGSYGAVEGCKDDLVMVTAIGLWICFKYMPMPKIVEQSTGKTINKIVSEATI